MTVIADGENSVDYDNVFAGVEISLPQRYVNGGAKKLTQNRSTLASEKYGRIRLVWVSYRSTL